MASHLSTTSAAQLGSPPSAATAVPVAINLSSMSQRSTSTVSVKHVVPAGYADGRPTLARVWREIQGASDWRDLVEPLHPLLRAEIVRYGELVDVCYKAFDLDPESKRFLNCKYGKRQMLRAVGVGDGEYVVTRYIYAAPDVVLPVGIGPGRSRWIGYVAVASDEEVHRIGRRDILVSFRGTVTSSEWVANFMSALAPARFDPADPRPDVRVESGFLSLYTYDDVTYKFPAGSCRNQLLSEISRLIRKHKHEELSITLAGHSMGSSLAILLGYDLAELGLNRDRRGSEVPVTVYSFAGPRVGNLEFKKRCDELSVKVLRVVNVNDPVTKMPGVFLNEKVRTLGERFELPWSHACYTHVGIEVALDFFKVGNLACVHEIGAYIELLRRPNNKVAKVIKEGEGVFARAKKFVLDPMLDSWKWRIRAGESLQALRK